MSSPSGSANSPIGNDPVLVAKVTAFLCAIGIQCQHGKVGRSFINNVRIHAGALVINSKSTVGDILHEAGHVAIVPESLRHHAQGDLSGLERAISKAMDKVTYEQWERDDPAAKALLQIGDPEATAWAWAAGKHLDLPEHLIIQDDHYDGEGATIRFMLSHKQYAGINGMVTSRMLARIGAYPDLQRWTQQ